MLQFPEQIGQALVEFKVTPANTGVMESWWGERKNPVVNGINNGEDFYPALIPCFTSACDRGLKGFFGVW
jgi:hypothetical protein